MDAPRGRYTRALLLAAGLGCMAAYGGWILVPLFIGPEEAPPWMQWSVAGTPVMFMAGENGGGRVLLYLGLLLVTQWAFLRPMLHGPKGGGKGGRTMSAAVLAVALMATLLSTGLIATLLEMPDWWVKLTTTPPEAHSSMPGPGGDNMTGQAAVLTAMAVLWILWTGIFFVYWQQGDYLTKTGRVIGWLIRGSCLELLIAIPTHAWAYRRSSQTDCYCTLGTYTGLVFGFGVLCWAFGPGLVLLFLREKNRRAEVLGWLCPKCGALRGPDGSCPACVAADPGN